MNAGLMLAVIAGIVFGVTFGLAMLMVIFIHKLRSATQLTRAKSKDVATPCDDMPCGRPSIARPLH